VGSDQHFLILLSLTDQLKLSNYGVVSNRRLKVRVTDVLHNFNPTSIASVDIVNIGLRNLQ
jgi:hypothetical protein